MLSWSVPPTASATVPVDTATRLVSAVGGEGFVDEFHALVREVAPVLRSALFVYDRHAQPLCILATSQGSARVAPVESQRYAKRYFRLDPVRSLMNSTSPTQLQACVLDAAGIDDVDYRGSYHQVGLNDRLSLVMPVDGGGWLAVNLYRDAAAGHFQPGEIDRLCALAPLVGSFALRHVELTRPPVAGRTVTQCRERLLNLDRGLPERELDVCALILKGLTANEIASDLGVSPSTVVCYRKRAYARLGVANHKELQARCF